MSFANGLKMLNWNRDNHTCEMNKKLTDRLTNDRNDRFFGQRKSCAKKRTTKINTQTLCVEWWNMGKKGREIHIVANTKTE